MTIPELTAKSHRRTIGSGFLTAGLLLTFLLAVGVGSSNAEPEEPIDRAKISTGSGLFRSWCRTCHGAEANGNGPMAKFLDPAPADLTKLSEKEGGRFYFGRVKAKIDGREKVRGHGPSDMPVWGDAFLILDEEGGEESVRRRIDSLAHYLRSIQAETQD